MFFVQKFTEKHFVFKILIKVLHNNVKIIKIVSITWIAINLFYKGEDHMSYKLQKNVTNCSSLVERDEEVIARCQHLSYYPLAVADGKGEFLKDEDVNEYIDFLTSASSLNLGSSNETITQAIQEQLNKYTQYTVAYCYNKKNIEYAERLTSVYPGGVKAKVCFGNCGSDGNDAAIKFARAYTGRTKIISFINGYHGNTYGSSSLTTVTTRMRDKMGPFLPEIYHFPFFGEDVPDDVCERECLREMEAAFARTLPVSEVAAVIIEPIQGDAGILPAHPIFMQKLYKLCKDNGILFISEEVQQGFFRAGHWFSIENYPGIIPDGIIMGKSIGAGLTLGAFMGRAEIMDVLPAPAHLFTLGGNALACAAGCAAFDIYKSADFQEQLAVNSAKIVELMQKLKEKYPQVIDFYRGRAMSYGIGIKEINGEDAASAAFKIAFRAYEKGLIIITIGGNILRVQPPLNIKLENMEKAFNILDEAIKDFCAGNIPDDVFTYRHGW